MLDNERWALNKCRTFETDFRCCPCQVHDHRCDDELHVFDWDEPCPTDYVIEEEGGFECVWFDRDFYYDYIFYDNEEASITEINCRRKCTNDEYYDKDTRLCARCHESCLNCNSSGIDGCISCKYEINDTCVTNCAGYTALSQDEHTTVGTREPYRQLEVDCTHTTKVNERVEYLTPNHYEPVEDPKEIAEKNRTDLKKGCTDMANMMQKESTIVDKKSNFVSDFKITEESQKKNYI
ncbi:hypothetical protein MAR_031813 [Mya arenaria]|uniref:Uncharacterized protein n=1 Tax=Mya arenaria TaxID=6604 RepID=A0ABY7F771_MYAAR|nr:hypothetical protein MAR_031813 [Mya arenaria]